MNYGATSNESKGGNGGAGKMGKRGSGEKGKDTGPPRHPQVNGKERNSTTKKGRGVNEEAEPPKGVSNRTIMGEKPGEKTSSNRRKLAEKKWPDGTAT